MPAPDRRTTRQRVDVDAIVTEMAATAPPLTGEQRDRLTLLLCPPRYPAAP